MATSLQPRPCVHVSVSSADPTLLTIIVDRTAPRGEILRQFKAALRRFGAYRQVDPRVFTALKLKKAQGLSYRKAALAVFGDEKYEGRLRHWHRKLNAWEWDQ